MIVVCDTLNPFDLFHCYFNLIAPFDKLWCFIFS
jgi:hypothetical protein